VLCDEDVLAVGPFRLKILVQESLAQRGPFPEAESLTDAAAMPPQAHENTAVWRVKYCGPSAALRGKVASSAKIVNSVTVVT
jgi:hypothetical protein